MSGELHIAYAIARGKDPSKGFSPITNPNKLSNGCTPWQTYNAHLRRLGNQPTSDSQQSKSDYSRLRANEIMNGIGISREHLD